MVRLRDCARHIGRGGGGFGILLHVIIIRRASFIVRVVIMVDAVSTVRGSILGGGVGVFHSREEVSCSDSSSIHSHSKLLFSEKAVD